MYRLNKMTIQGFSTKVGNREHFQMNNNTYSLGFQIIPVSWLTVRKKAENKAYCIVMFTMSLLGI